MKPIKLNEEQVNLFRKQVLIILADYRNTRPSEVLNRESKNPLADEGTRVDISERILSNLLLIGRAK